MPQASPPAGQSSSTGASSRPAGWTPGTTPSQLPEALRSLLARVNQIHPELGMGGLAKRTPVQVPDVVPDGAQFIAGAYSNQAGSRDYKLYVPSGYRGQPIPLVVMLHGCTQSPDDFAAGTRMNVLAEEHTCLAAYPAQAASANASKCWNWFSARDQQRDHRRMPGWPPRSGSGRRRGQEKNVPTGCLGGGRGARPETLSAFEHTQAGNVARVEV